MKITIPPGSLDGHLTAYRNPGTEFILLPGEYYTRGAFAFPEHDLCMLAPECSLIGAGSDRTTIELVNEATSHNGKPTQYVEVLTGGARTRYGSVHLRFEGFTVDPLINMPVVALHAWTSRATIRDVVVRSVCGSRTWAGPVKEGFGILVNNAATPDPVDGGHVIEDCTVYATGYTADPIEGPAAAENYVTGIFVGCPKRYPVPMLQSCVRRCRVVGLDIGSGATHAGFAANAMTQLDDCEAWHVRRAMFCDTGPVENVTINRLRAHGIEWALDLRVAESGHYRRFIDVRDSEFYFAADPHGGWNQAVLLADETGRPETVIEHVRFDRCRFVSAAPQASEGRLRGLVRNVSFRSCEWVGSGDWRMVVLQDGAKEVQSE